MIPQILALDIEFGLTNENHQKTVNLKLDLNKEKFDELNKNRKENNKDQITLKQVESLVVKGIVKKDEDRFYFEMKPDEEEKELYELIKPILELDFSYFKTKKTTFLHLAPNFGELMKSNNYEKIKEEYFLNIRNLSIKKDISEEDFQKIQEKDNKFHSVYKSLLHQPLKQIEDVLLPTLCKAEECQFYNEIKDGYYKYNIYLPEDYLWEMPKNMKGEVVKADNIKFIIRYLNLEEIDDSMKHTLDEEYINNNGKSICEEIIELDKENPFEKNWSTELLKQTNSIVETHTFPKFYKDKDQLKISSPGKTQNLLLRLYFGINNEFFDKKIKWESQENLNM